jgi:hypothetical protein
LVHPNFPKEHWRRVRTNNPLERILREIRRRNRVVGAFPDGQSALNLAAARVRHIARQIARGDYEPSGHNDSERECGLESERNGKPNLQPKSEGSMISEN